MLFAEEWMSGLHSWMVGDTRSAFEMVMTAVLESWKDRVCVLVVIDSS